MYRSFFDPFHQQPRGYRQARPQRYYEEEEEEPDYYYQDPFGVYGGRRQQQELLRRQQLARQQEAIKRRQLEELEYQRAMEEQRLLREQQILQQKQKREEMRRKKMELEMKRREEEEKARLEEAERRARWEEYVNDPEVRETAANIFQKSFRGWRERRNGVIQKLKELAKVNQAVQAEIDQDSAFVVKTSETTFPELSHEFCEEEKKENKDLLYRVQSYEEKLTKQLLNLDGIPSGRSEFVRTCRKELVNKINEELAVVDKAKKVLVPIRDKIAEKEKIYNRRIELKKQEEDLKRQLDELRLMSQQIEGEPMEEANSPIVKEEVMEDQQESVQMEETTANESSELENLKLENQRLLKIIEEKDLKINQLEEQLRVAQGKNTISSQ